MLKHAREYYQTNSPIPNNIRKPWETAAPDNSRLWQLIYFWGNCRQEISQQHPSHQLPTPGSMSRSPGISGQAYHTRGCSTGAEVSMGMRKCVSTNLVFLDNHEGIHYDRRERRCPWPNLEDNEDHFAT